MNITDEKVIFIEKRRNFFKEIFACIYIVFHFLKYYQPLKQVGSILKITTIKKICATNIEYLV